MAQSLSGLASATMIHLGRDPIADLDASTQQEAAIFKERFPPVRDALLRAYPWNFAMRFASLPGKALPTPQFGFTHECALPSGGRHEYCLRLWKLEVKQPHQVQGRKLLLKSAPPVTIAYIARIEDAEAFDPMFHELLALDMALALLNRVPAADTKKRGNDLRNARNELRRTARLTDAMEASPGETTGDDLGSWIGARRPL